ncbi:MAG TPA: sulfate ABC transporter substrate-binding protein [Propionibacterium sp.]|jgi:sulfate transport system substrate-binding protein|nr:sulfate ABC transporter substrate-binding protein [Propionibacterium sp.]
MSPPRAAVALLLVLALVGCVPGGGASDVPRRLALDSGTEGTHTTLNLFAYAVPKVAYDELVPAFGRTSGGRGIAIQQSFGASGDQSRKVAAGAAADIVNFSVEPDITRLVEAGLVDPEWRAGAHDGVPYGSVVTIVVRAGNPKNIRDWDDLLRPGIEVVTPNPFSSGAAKWNLLAPYAAKSDGGRDPAAGLAYVRELVHNHVKLQPKSGREATEAFLQGTGDVLLSYENEALFIERKGEPVEHVIPDVTFRIDNPAAVLAGSPNRDAAQQFLDFVNSADGQRILAETGFRPADPAIAREFATEFGSPDKLWSIDDLGGWPTVDANLFKAGSGSIAQIYEGAAR